MATHELYLGGDASSNLNRAQFPSATFNAASATALAMRAAAHKGPTQFALTRTLDFANDPALVHFMQNNTVATGDVLNLIVIPKNVITYGVYVEVENPGTVAGATLAVTVGATAFGAAVDLTTAGSSFATPAAAAAVTDDVVDLGTATFANVPKMLSGTLTITDAADLDGLRIHISPLVSEVLRGQF